MHCRIILASRAPRTVDRRWIVKSRSVTWWLFSTRFSCIAPERWVITPTSYRRNPHIMELLRPIVAELEIYVPLFDAGINSYCQRRVYYTSAVPNIKRIAPLVDMDSVYNTHSYGAAQHKLEVSTRERDASVDGGHTRERGDAGVRKDMCFTLELWVFVISV